MDPESSEYGFAYAGYYMVDPKGVVIAKFFNESNNDRYTSANILSTQFGSAGELRQTVKNKQFKATYSASNPTLRPGQRAALIVEVNLKKGVHLYAPGEHSYVIVDWTMDAVEGAEFLETDFPPSTTMHLPAIQETVPVYESKLRLTRDIHLLGGRHMPEVLKGVDSLKTSGTLRYQACDAKGCYPPDTIPLEWTFELKPHDLTRVPDEIRRAN